MQLIARIAVFYVVFKVVKKLVDQVFKPTTTSTKSKKSDIIEAEFREID